MGRRSKPFALTPEEAKALDAARRHFLASYEDLPPLNPKALADLRKAARAMHKALGPVLDSHMNPTAARLLMRMQEVEGCHRTQRHYADLLTTADYTASLTDRACAADVRRGRKSDERSQTWIPAPPWSIGATLACL